MRAAAFIKRNLKEIVTDPFSLIFGMGLPLLLLIIMSSIGKSTGVDIFEITKFAPGIAMFSFSFLSLFTGLLIAKDRGSSFLQRLFASPLTASDYIASYALPLLPVAIVQSSVCFIAAFFFGLQISWNVLLAIAVLLPSAVFFIGCGLLLGTLLTDRQVGGVNSILIQAASLLGGIWFDPMLIGGGFKTACYILPFMNGVDASYAALTGNYKGILVPLAVTAAYAVVAIAAAVILFRKKMKP